MKQSISHAKKSENKSFLTMYPDLWNIDAEQAVIGGLLLESQCYDDIHGLESYHFYHSRHQHIFEAIQALLNQNKPCDLILVIEYLIAQKKTLPPEDESYLWELANNVRTTANMAHYAKLIKEKWTYRHLVKACQSVLEKVYSPEVNSLEESLDFAETQLFHLRENPTTAHSHELSSRQLLANLFNQWEKKENNLGLPSGFSTLDQLTGGFKASQLVILAARPSMGKTTLALNIATHVARQQPVLFFSLETPANDLLTKIISAEKQLSLISLQQGNFDEKNWHQLFSMAENSAIDNLFFDEPPRLSIQDIRSKLRRFIRKQGRVGLLVVDYLQLMSIPGYNANQRVAEISEISRGLKAIAREFKIPVLALSQLNRELERRTDRRPMMADLRESGAIEQDADLILFIYRDEVYNADTAIQGQSEIIIAKNRNGQVGKAHLQFEGQYSRFKETYFMPEYLK